jgi:NAD(P)-dependent dehydrogenase (short-subunit alcohol dehydrogenase family)
VSVVNDHKGVVVITGACGGMGRVCVAAFAPRARIIAVDLDRVRVEALAEELRSSGCDVTGVRLDISSAGSAAELAQLARGAGTPAALVHTAGLSPSMGEPQRIMDVNLIATQGLANAFFEVAAPGFSAVMIASTAGHYYRPEADLAKWLSEPLAADFWPKVASHCPNSDISYGLSKWGVIALCEREAARWGRKGARINSVSPGLIDTPMGRLEAAQHPEGIGRLSEICPVGRWGRPEDIAGAVAYLCSEAASFVTGIDLLVDGGTTSALRHAGALS